MLIRDRDTIDVYYQARNDNYRNCRLRLTLIRAKLYKQDDDADANVGTAVTTFLARDIIYYKYIS